MNIERTGETARVTGSTGGTGLATAREPAPNGAGVADHGRTGQTVDAAIAGASTIPDRRAR